MEKESTGVQIWLLRCLWLLVALSATAIHLPATSAEAWEFVGRSEVVFVGRLIESESLPSPDERLLLTRYYFEVEDGWKGSTPEIVAITEFGGRHGGVTLTVTHSPVFSTQERYLIFAGRDSRGRLRTLDGPAGQFWLNPASDGRLHIRIPGGHPLAELFGKGSRLISLEQLRTRLELKEMGNEER